MAANTNNLGLFQLIAAGDINPNAMANTVDSGLMISAIEMTVAEHNAAYAATLAPFCEDTYDYQVQVDQEGGGRSQGIDEFGRAKPSLPGAPYTVAFPLQGSANAMGSTYLMREQMTVADTAKAMSEMLKKDVRWGRDHVLNALLSRTAYAHRDVTKHGDLTIKGMANTDGIKYVVRGSDDPAEDEHYLAQAAAIADATNPFGTIRTELMEHAENGGEVVNFVASNLVASIAALAEYRSAQLNPHISYGPNVATISPQVGASGYGFPASFFGFTAPPNCVLRGGLDSGGWVVEWPSIPSGYIASVTTAGPRPLARRMFPQPSLQGFRSVGKRQDFPYFEDQWQRWEGFGGRNRVGAVLTRIGNANWAAPTGYGAYMP